MLTPSKKKFILAAILILVVVFFILRKKEEPFAYAPTMGDPVAVADQVKGSEVTQSRAPAATPAATHGYTAEAAKSRLAMTPENVLWFTNYYRFQNRLAPLRGNGRLDKSAQAKNADMLARQYFEHTRPTGAGFDSFIDAQNYSFIKIGENLAMGDFMTAKEVVDAWMKSDSHRRNILDPAYAELGVGIATGTYQGRQTTFLTQHFGTPRAACPSIDESDRVSIKTASTRMANLAESIKSKRAVLEQDAVLDDDSLYDQLVREYNGLVANYFLLQQEVQDLVTDYNRQVEQFDACIKRTEQG